MTGKDILTHAGNIGHEQVIDKAKEEYNKFKAQTRNDLSTVEEDFFNK